MLLSKFENKKNFFFDYVSLQRFHFWLENIIRTTRTAQLQELFQYWLHENYNEKNLLKLTIYDIKCGLILQKCAQNKIKKDFPSKTKEMNSWPEENENYRCCAQVDGSNIILLWCVAIRLTCFSVGAVKRHANESKHFSLNTRIVQRIYRLGGILWTFMVNKENK